MSIDRVAAGLWTFLAYFGLIMLAGAENAMSAYAGYNFGTHDLERYLYAAAYSGNELLKVALLWKLGQAFAQPGSLTVKALRIGVGALVLTPLVLLISLSGHVGFVGLVRGDTFGEDALLTNSTRNATVVMKTAGKLMRLSSKDFTEVMKPPVVDWVTPGQASILVRQGAIVLDVRLPEEFNDRAVKGAVNVPLFMLRERAADFERGRKVVVYCNTGERSAAAAFILSKMGVPVFALQGGLSAMIKQLEKSAATEKPA